MQIDRNYYSGQMRNRSIDKLRWILLLAGIVFASMSAWFAEAEAQMIEVRPPLGGGTLPLGGSTLVGPGGTLTFDSHTNLKIELKGTLSNQNFNTPPQPQENGTTVIAPKNTSVIVERPEEDKVVIVPPPPTEYPISALYTCASTEWQNSGVQKTCDEIATYYLFSIAPETPLSLEPETLSSLTPLNAGGNAAELVSEANALLNEGNSLLKEEKFDEAKEKYELALSKLSSIRLSLENADNAAETLQKNISLCDFYSQRATLYKDAFKLLRVSKFDEAKAKFEEARDRERGNTLSDQLRAEAACSEKWMLFCDAKKIQQHAGNDNQMVDWQFMPLTDASDKNTCGTQLHVAALIERALTHKYMSEPIAALQLLNEALHLGDDPDQIAFADMIIGDILSAQFANKFQEACDRFEDALLIVKSLYIRVNILKTYAVSLAMRHAYKDAARELCDAEGLCIANQTECEKKSLDEIAWDRVHYDIPECEAAPTEPTENITVPPDDHDRTVGYFILSFLAIAVILVAICILRKFKKWYAKRRAAKQFEMSQEVTRRAVLLRFRNYVELNLQQMAKFELQTERLLDDIIWANGLTYKYYGTSFNPYLQRIEVSFSDPENPSLVNIKLNYDGQLFLTEVVDLNRYKTQ